MPLAGSAGAKRGTGAGGPLANEHGWTLAELMVVTGLVVVLAGIAVPRFNDLAAQMHAQAAAARVLSDVNWTRMMTIRTGVPHYLNVTGDPAIAYDIRRSQNPPAIAPTTDPLLRSIDLSGSMPDVEFALNGAGADPYGGIATTNTPGLLIFGTRGLPVAPGSFYVASVDGSTGYAVSVTGAGSTRLWRRADGAWK